MIAPLLRGASGSPQLVCNKLTGPPLHKWSVIINGPPGHPVHVRHKWYPAAVSGPPYLWGAVCLKITYTLMFSTGIDV